MNLTNKIYGDKSGKYDSDKEKEEVKGKNNK